jgi:Leucine-rich repeat (LRR) protein
MKNFLLFLLLIFLPVLAPAQTVIMARDTAKDVMLLENGVTKTASYRPSVLAKKYPNALAKVANEKTAFTNRQVKMFYDSMTARRSAFFKFDERNKGRIPVRGTITENDVFVNSDGRIGLVICQFDTVAKLTPDQEEATLTVIQEWYQTYPTFFGKTTTGFQFQDWLMLGGFIEKRKVRSGPGIINTLESARNTTRPDTVKSLLLNQLELLSIPEDIYRFPNLIELDLSKNALHELPARLTTDLPKLQKLSLIYNKIPDDSVFFSPNKHLTSLNLQGNRLTNIPASVKQNKRLQSLWMGNNELKNLNVNSFRKLRRLTDLNLYNAGLTALPTGIGRLKRLKILDIYYNNFTELPRQIGRLRRLEELGASHNQLRELPESVGKLRRLRKLYVHHTQIGRLPESLARLQKLTLLDLSYDFFSTTPNVVDKLMRLEDLDLSNNNLQTLSVGLGALPNLQKLYLRENPILRTAADLQPYLPIIERLEAQKTEVFR